MSIKITDLTALTGLATGDFFAVVDISDTSQATTGTTKKITEANVAALLLAAPAFTGIVTIAGASVRTPNAMAALAVDVTQGNNTKTIAGDSTITFSGTPANTEQWFSLRLTNSDTNPHTITIPSSYSMGRQTAITSVVIPASGKVFLTWDYDGAAYNLYGDPNLTSGSGAFVLVTGATLVAPNLGTPASGSLGSCTGYGVTNLGGLGSQVGTFLTTPSSANLAAAITDETGTGALMFGTNPGLSITAPTTNTVGYLGIPQNSNSAAYTTVLSDSGKHIFHPAADTTARTFTIDSNSNVAYPIGTTLTFINQNAGGVITIAITSDTMRLAGAGTTGSRTLAANGIATAVKVANTEWLINGTGLT